MISEPAGRNGTLGLATRLVPASYALVTPAHAISIVSTVNCLQQTDVGQRLRQCPLSHVATSAIPPPTSRLQHPTTSVCAVWAFTSTVPWYLLGISRHTPPQCYVPPAHLDNQLWSRVAWNESSQRALLNKGLWMDPALATDSHSGRFSYHSSECAAWLRGHPAIQPAITMQYEEPRSIGKRKCERPRRFVPAPPIRRYHVDRHSWTYA